MRAVVTRVRSASVENVTRFAQSAGYKVAVADFEGDFKLTLTK